MAKSNTNTYNVYRIKLTSHTNEEVYIPSSKGEYIPDEEASRKYAEICQNESESWRIISLQTCPIDELDWHSISIYHTPNPREGRMKVKFKWVGPKGSSELLPTCPSCGEVVSNNESCIFCHQKFLQDCRLLDYFYPKNYE